MFSRRFRNGVVGAALLLALATGTTQAQVYGIGPSEYTSGSSFSFGRYDYYYGPSPLAPYGHRHAYEVTGSPMSTPIFMTSINYPGVYGAYTLGGAAQAYNNRGTATNYLVASGTTLRLDVEPTRGALPAPAPLPSDSVARVDVHVPGDANLWFEGVRMTQGGTTRRFVSPPLVSGQDYTYEVRASWTENGQEVARDRTVRVRAGERVDVDLRGAAPRESGTSTLRTDPFRFPSSPPPAVPTPTPPDAPPAPKSANPPNAELRSPGVPSPGMPSPPARPQR
jgi:uncharacterized protein (TIGR03000 family)